MKRLLVALAGLVALAVSTTGCNAHLLPYAAVVNGSTVSETTFTGSMSAVASNQDYRCLIGAGPGGSVHVEGAGESTYATSFGANELSFLVQQQVVHQLVQRLRLTVPANVAPIAAAQLNQAFTPPSGSGCTGTGAQILAEFPSSYRQSLVQFQSDEDVISAHLAGMDMTPAGIARYAAANPSVGQMACISAIVVNTQAEAAALRGRALAGASFASLAKAHSIDTQSAANGGVIGCAQPSRFGAPLGTVITATPVGHISKPLKVHSVWVIIEVTGHQPVTTLQVVDGMAATVQPGFSAVVTAAMNRSHVQVDPQYGSWATIRNIRQVVAPVPPPPNLVPDPAAMIGPLEPSAAPSGSSSSGLTPVG